MKNAAINMQKILDNKLYITFVHVFIYVFIYIFILMQLKTKK